MTLASKLTRPAALLVAALVLSPAPTQAQELACASAGDLERCALPDAVDPNVTLEQELSGTCRFETAWWADADGIVVDKGCGAVFAHEVPAEAQPAGTDMAASDAYDKGCTAGRKDAEATMSMACGRHDGQLDRAEADGRPGSRRALCG